jgi:hypothetical protein
MRGTGGKQVQPTNTGRAKLVPDTAVIDGVQRGATETPIVTPRRRPQPLIAGQGLFLLGGGSRIRTLEGISRRIYSPNTPACLTRRFTTSSRATASLQEGSRLLTWTITLAVCAAGTYPAQRLRGAKRAACNDLSERASAPSVNRTDRGVASTASSSPPPPPSPPHRHLRQHPQQHHHHHDHLKPSRPARRGVSWDDGDLCQDGLRAYKAWAVAVD